MAGGRVPPGNAGEGGEQVVAVLVRLHQQEVTEYHRLQLLLLLLHAAYGDFLRFSWWLSTTSNFTTQQGSDLEEEEALGAIIAFSAKKCQSYGSYFFLDGAVTSLLRMMQYLGSWRNHLVIKCFFPAKNLLYIKNRR